MLALSATVQGCGSPTEPDGAENPVVYLEEMIEIMRTNSINRLTIDWAAFRATVLGTSPDAKTIRQAHPAITAAFRLLGDGHSFYLNGATALGFPTRSCGGQAGPPQLPTTIGYVKVDAFSGDSAAAL